MLNLRRRLSVAIIGCMLSGLTPGFQGWVTDVYAEETTASTDRAEYLLDEDFSFLALTSEPDDIVASGWDVRRAGGSIAFNINDWFRMRDTSGELPVSMNKKIRAQQTGQLTLEYRFRMPAIVDGMSWQLRSGATAGVNLEVAGGSLRLETGGGLLPLQALSANTEYGVKVVADLDTRKTDVYVNGVLKASAADFAHYVAAVDNFLVKTGDTTTGDLYVAPVNIHKGYAVNEKFVSAVAGPLPGDWSSQLSGGVIAVEKMNNAKPPDVYSLRMDAAQAVGVMSVGKSVYSASGQWVLEYKALLSDKTEGFAAELKQGGTSSFRLQTTADGAFSYRSASGPYVAFYDYTPNLWYHVKLKLDTGTGKADLYLNGKLAVQQLDITPGAFDGLAFTIGASNRGSMALDDIRLYKEAGEPEDYVPAPLVPGKVTGAPLVGVQACPLWREGQHLGWDRINPYPERVPLLGFYDEGNPETSDWEIKWMAEHGIDFQMQCWYRPTGSLGKPIKDPRLGMSIHDGYFNAKYSDRVKFAIQWENASIGASGSDDFRNNLVPYWLEYYFKDPRYLVIDNKPVIGIYNFAGLRRDFGGTAEGVKAEIDYLRQACKDAGFDDAIILISYSSADATAFGTMQSAGLDAVFAYSFGKLAGVEALQKTKLEQQRDTGSMNMVPVISMGRDDRAWGGTAGYYSTAAEFESTARWVKDTLVPSLPGGSPGRKMVLLDNWNEYGEGHFMMPAGLNGFGYLDALRSVFTTGGAHADVQPTAAQKQRIGVLYPEGRVLPSRVKPAPTITNTYSAVWDFNSDGDAEGWTVAKQVYGPSVAGGYYSGTSTGGDPGLYSPSPLNLSAEDHPYIHIRMKNATGDVRGQIYFTTETDPAWSETSSTVFVLHPNDSAYTDYYVPMWGDKRWTGTIKALRFDPVTTAGSFSIDKIGLMYSPPPGIRLYMDRQPASTLTPIVTIDGSVMAPLAELLAKAGVVSETADDQSLVAVKDGQVVRITPGQSTAYIGGAPVSLDHAPVQAANGLLVSSDALEKLFGYTVQWDAAEQILYVSSRTVKVRGDNLVIDPGMELSTLSYTGDRITAQLNATEYHSGRQSVKVKKNAAYSKIYFPGVENGKEYYYSAWGKLDAASTAGEKLRICLQYKLDGVIKQVVMIVGPAMDAVSWKQAEGYFKLNETGIVTDLTMYIYTDTPALADTFYLDDVEIRPVTYSNDPVPARVTGVQLNKSSLALALGKSERLLATVTPSNAIERRIVWSTDKSNVAIVDVNGAVYGNQEGVAYVTATSLDSGQAAVSRVMIGTDKPAAAFTAAPVITPGSMPGSMSVTAGFYSSSGGMEPAYKLFAEVSSAPIAVPGTLSGVVPAGAIPLTPGVPARIGQLTPGTYIGVYERNESNGEISRFYSRQLQAADIAPNP